MSDLSYSLSLVVKFLDENGIKYKFASPNLDCICEHGVRVQINDRFSVSIQTHPNIANSAFAETLLFDGDEMANGEYRWKTPEQLYEYIRSLKV